MVHLTKLAGRFHKLGLSLRFHCRVSGIHLLDSMEDGTEMVAPDPFLGLNSTTPDENKSSGE